MKIRMRKNYNYFQWIITLLFVATMSTSVSLIGIAQTETGQIVGAVTDPNSAVIAAAKVKIVNVGTGTERSASTDSQGNYVVTNLIPALYEVTIEASGFAAVKKRVQVTVGSKVTADFQLSVGTTQAIVEVVAGAGVQVNTETQTIAEVIDSRKVTELPSVTRNPYAFVLSAGNVSPGDPQDNGPTSRGVGVAINGLRAASTNILLDGAANNDEFNANVGQGVPLDAVQEYSIITNNFTAEFGRASGGIVNVATKSGTNDYHGTAYQFGRYSNLNSNNFLNNANALPKNVYTRNQFGYSIGGPVIKDKLQFFQSTEFLRIRSTNNRIVVVPTPQFIALADPATQAYFNTYGQLRDGTTVLGTIRRQDLPASFCPAGSVCDGLVSPGTPVFTRLSYNYASDSGGGDPQNSYSLVGRMDWNISEKTQFYGRYALERSTQFDGTISDSPYAGFDTGQNITNNSVLFSLIHTLSPQLVSQSKLVFNRLNLLQPQGASTPTLYWRDGAATTRFLNDLAALPGYLPFTPGNAIPFGGPQNFIQVYQDFNYSKGRHNPRFGGSYVYIRDNRTFGAFQDSVAGLGTTTPGVDNFLLGQLARFQGAVDPQGKFPCPDPTAATPECSVTLPVGQPSFSRSNRYHEFAFYGQDSWRIKPRVTLNLGLRWEYFGVQHHKDPSLDSNFYPASGGNVFQNIRNGVVATTPNSPINGLWAKDWNNFAPRLGFAWDIFGDGKTSLRGGYGIGYERNFGNVTFNVIQNPPNYAVIAVTSADLGGMPISIPTNVAGPLGGASGMAGLPSVSLRTVDPNIRTSFAHLWSASIEREVRRNLVVALDYSGSSGEKLYSIENPNRVGSGAVYLGDADPTARLRTSQYTNINARSGNGFSNYHAFNMRVNINNFSNSGLRLTTNFTWSHAIDNLSSSFSESNNNFNLGLLDPFNPGLDRGNADFDIRRRFVVSGIWDVPFAKSTKGLFKQVLDGWEVAPIFTANTGTPFTVFDCTNGITYCPRVFATGTLPSKGASNPAQDPNTPGTFSYLDITGLTDSSFVNPLTGTTEVGPYPSNMIGRDFFRGPGRWNLDMGLYKNFQLNERFKLQYRAEFYNMFNHANAYILGSQADVSSTTVINSQKDGNRNIQMALKLIF
jgi:carboxypeptidase family protein